MSESVNLGDIPFHAPFSLGKGKHHRICFRLTEEEAKAAHAKGLLRVVYHHIGEDPGYCMYALCNENSLWSLSLCKASFFYQAYHRTVDPESQAALFIGEVKGLANHDLATLRDKANKSRRAAFACRLKNDAMSLSALARSVRGHIKEMERIGLPDDNHVVAITEVKKVVDYILGDSSSEPGRSGPKGM